MRLQIKTSSRLHFGLMDLCGNLGRIYGSLGVALKNPRVVIEIKGSEKLAVKGEHSSLIRSLVKKFSRHYSITPKVEIIVKETVPQHQGLGSGTQLSLAIAAGLARIYDINVRVRELAKVMGRGKISAIGLGAFELGGFIIDGGKKMDNMQEIPPIIFHSNFPEEWKFLVVIPEGEGIHSTKEEEAFERIIPSDPKIACEISRLLQMKLLPSLMEKNLDSFGEALTEIDRKNGEYFKKVQEGMYKEKITGELVTFLLEQGAKGAGQSSWGPAVYALAAVAEMNELEKSVRDFFEEKDNEVTIYKSEANNSGAELSIL